MAMMGSFLAMIRQFTEYFNLEGVPFPIDTSQENVNKDPGQRYFSFLQCRRRPLSLQFFDILIIKQKVLNILKLWCRLRTSAVTKLAELHQVFAFSWPFWATPLTYVICMTSYFEARGSKCSIKSIISTRLSIP